jgi:hypothetical protein
MGNFRLAGHLYQVRSISSSPAQSIRLLRGQPLEGWLRNASPYDTVVWWESHRRARRIR